MLLAVNQKHPELQHGLWAFASRGRLTKSSAAVRTLGLCFSPSNKSMFSCSTDSGRLLFAVNQKIVRCGTEYMGLCFPRRPDKVLQYGLWAFAFRRQPKTCSAAVRTLGVCFSPSTKKILCCSTDYMGLRFPRSPGKVLQYGLWAFAFRRQASKTKNIFSCSADSGSLLLAVNQKHPQLQHGLWAFASRGRLTKSSAAVRTLGLCSSPSTKNIKHVQLQYGLWAFAFRRQPKNRPLRYGVYGPLLPAVA